MTMVWELAVTCRVLPPRLVARRSHLVRPCLAGDACFQVWLPGEAASIMPGSPAPRFGRSVRPRENPCRGCRRLSLAA